MSCRRASRPPPPSLVGPVVFTNEGGKGQIRMPTYGEHKKHEEDVGQALNGLQSQIETNKKGIAACMTTLNQNASDINQRLDVLEKTTTTKLAETDGNVSKLETRITRMQDHQKSMGGTTVDSGRSDLEVRLRQLEQTVDTLQREYAEKNKESEEQDKTIVTLQQTLEKLRKKRTDPNQDTVQPRVPLTPGRKQALPSLQTQ